MNDRRQHLDRLRARTDWPVVIVGAGINGIATFRDLSLQGVDCLLIDTGDFCSGASSAPSRMIHGGLKYLETGEFRLVGEATHERNRLLKNAPHLVRPLETVVPLHSRLGGLTDAVGRFFGRKGGGEDRGAWIVKLGFALYDFLGRKERTMPTHRMMDRAQALESVPGLDPSIVGAGIYYDAWITQPERLGVELVLDGEAANPASLGLNHVALDSHEADRLVLVDRIGGERFEVRPTILVNAAGAWIDGANRAAGISSRHIGGTKGSHLLLDHPGMHRALAGRMIYFGRKDGRICLAYPFLDKVLTGSTDLRTTSPDSVVCEDSEIDYMLGALREVFPKLRIERDQIVYTYCGVRPLPASDAANPGAVSRDHSMPVHEPRDGRPFPVLCLVGGKWTTFRAFGAEVADAVLARLGRPRRTGTENLPIGGGRPNGRAGDDPRLAQLHARYGSRAHDFLATLEGVNDPDRPLAYLPEFGTREIAWLCLAERAPTLADLVLRRTTIAITGRASLPAIEEMAGIAARTLGWDEARSTREIQDLLDELASRHRTEATATGQRLCP
ncbi:glycerol-3-phosphate dehydrogenase/oxidase [Geminicoccus roseus]|uniref:glycerol-3-phosphate dehydrogenase/oxidase n=1 Tax=Geminicoccus roseus TaxID=404900 RepID=UPI000400B99C|nr:glycerol-3-phosphate dehydrogenase/oxidase [Geminicoccus roseus]